MHLRLYAYHDMDLLALKESNKISSLVKDSLRAFLSKNETKFSFNPPVQVFYPVQGVYEIQIRLNPIEDTEIIDFIDTIPNGYRSGFIKNLLRMYVFNTYGFETALYLGKKENSVINSKGVVTQLVSQVPAPLVNPVKLKAERKQKNKFKPEISVKQKEMPTVTEHHVVENKPAYESIATSESDIEDDDDDLFLMTANITGNTSKISSGE